MHFLFLLVEYDGFKSYTNCSMKSTCHGDPPSCTTRSDNGKLYAQVVNTLTLADGKQHQTLIECTLTMESLGVYVGMVEAPPSQALVSNTLHDLYGACGA